MKASICKVPAPPYFYTLKDTFYAILRGWNHWKFFPIVICDSQIRIVPTKILIRVVESQVQPSILSYAFKYI